MTVVDRRRIPLSPYPDQRFMVSLGESRYVLRVQWFERLQAWSLSIATADGTPLLSCARLCFGVEYLLVLSSPNTPQGALMCIPTTAEDYPTYEGLGTTTLLFYFPEVVRV